MISLVRNLFAALCLLGSALALAQNGPVRLGQSLPLSGPLAELGSEYREGMLAYFNALNARGGIHGRKIELLTLDDAYVVERTVENTKRLLDQEEVFALLGMFGSANYAAALPLINERNIPSLAPYTGSDELRAQKSPTTFWLRASYGDETEKIVDQLTTLGINRIAVFYQDDAFGKSGLAGVERALARRNLKVVATGAFDKAKNDVRDAVKAIGAADPQGVVMVSTYKPTAAFVREMRQAGKMTQFFALSVVGYKALQAEMGASAAGIAIAQVVPYPWSSAVPVVREFQSLPAEFIPRSGPTYTVLEGYIAAKVMAEGLRQAGPNPTREKLVSALAGLRSHDLGGFTIDYGKAGRLGSRFVEVTIVGSAGRLLR